MKIIEATLRESKEYYQKRELEIICRISALPRGSLKRRRIGNKVYYYRQFREGRKVVHVYLGKEIPALMEQAERERRAFLEELGEVRRALQLLKVKEKRMIAEPVREIMKIFADEGLWEEGVTICGSWCFNIYQEYLGVPAYPVRTDDVDIVISIPFTGREVDIGGLLREIGFREMFNPDGSICYERPGLKVEFLVPERGRGTRKGWKIEKLGIVAQPLRFLDVLFMDMVEVKLFRGVKLKIPSPEAFLLHKLLVVEKRKREELRKKDLIQVVQVIRYVLVDQGRRKKLKSIYDSLSGGWKKRVLKAAESSKELLPLEEGVFGGVLAILAETRRKA